LVGVTMAKDYVKQSLERDAYLARFEDKQVAQQRLQQSAQRLAKLVALSRADTNELLNYANALIEQQDQEHPYKESQVRRRVMQARGEQQSKEKMPPVAASKGGTGASE
jgi:tellurite resistance protein